MGQRKVVNVHRLIMRGTLEEKVMSLRKFKVSAANAVINAENASLNTMNTDQLLDLFTSSQTGRKVIICLRHGLYFILSKKTSNLAKGTRRVLSWATSWSFSFSIPKHLNLGFQHTHPQTLFLMCVA